MKEKEKNFKSPINSTYETIDMSMKTAVNVFRKKPKHFRRFG